VAQELRAAYAVNDVWQTEAHLAVAEPSPAQLQLVLRKIREMIRYVDCASDAVLLARRTSAVGKLLDEALKSCRLLEEQQFELRQDATEAHLRTLRRAGELLAVMPLNSGGRPARRPEVLSAAADQALTLRELGITSHESHRWQRIAKLPHDWFEEHIRHCRQQRRELTMSGMLILAKRFLGESDDVGVGQERPSGRDAQLREYEAAKGYISNVIWLDPIALARAIDPVRRREELDCLRRWRTWLDEFELELVGARSRRVPATSQVPG